MYEHPDGLRGMVHLVQPSQRFQVLPTSLKVDAQKENAVPGAASVRPTNSVLAICEWTTRQRYLNFPPTVELSSAVIMDVVIVGTASLSERVAVS